MVICKFDQNPESPSIFATKIVRQFIWKLYFYIYSYRKSHVSQSAPQTLLKESYTRNCQYKVIFHLMDLIVNSSLGSYSHHAEEERLGPSESNCGENTHRPSDVLQQGESNF